jgi:hypothetical protein
MLVNQRDPEGKIIWPGESHTEEYAWEDLGDITVQQAALAGNARDYASVTELAAANRVLWTPQKRKVSLEFRFEMDGAENATSIIACYGHCPRIDSSGDEQNDEFTIICSLTLTQGTQEGNTASTYFADTLAEGTDKAWLSSTTLIQKDGGDNQCARWLINKHGYRDFIFIATTLSVNTIHVWGRRL